MGLKNVFDRMFLKDFYKPFHGECLKNISSIMLISLAILHMFKKRFQSNLAF